MLIRLFFGVMVLGFFLSVAHSGQRRFEFREPFRKEYIVNTNAASSGKGIWLEGESATDPEDRVIISNRAVLQLQPGAQLKEIARGSKLKVFRQIDAQTYVLEGPDALATLHEAERLARNPRVKVSHPVMRRMTDLDGPYAPLPNDPYFIYQWFFENRNLDGSRFGADLNLRSAWPVTRGAGVTIAVADTGLETNHPDLAARAADAPHFNFEIGEPNGEPPNKSAMHGTVVAGLAVASANNGIGVTGAAPEASLASWVVFGTNQTLSPRQFLVDDEQLMNMFQYQSNAVQVQNHSWGTRRIQFEPVGLLPLIGISNAVTFGRNGKGVVMTRSAGNDRTSGNNANDSAFRSDPRVICVAASRLDGRATSYSNPGACVLVGAVGGESSHAMFTTDLQGTWGYNFIQTQSDPDFWNYSYTFWGTSASAPQIAGLAGLILSVNTNLSYRDVQQILIHSARHFDLADPHLQTNQAGFVCGPNLGFGIPDAGEAVRLAKTWPTRPAQVVRATNIIQSAAIPDGGLKVLITGEDIPENLASIIAVPSVGPHPDSPTAVLPLVDAGLATNASILSLSNKAALIQRGVNSFSEKISNAAAAGARLAIVYNNSTNSLFVMGNTDFAPIPAVFINRASGEALRDLLQTNAASAQLKLFSTNLSFDVTQPLLCEHVGVRVSATHPSRGDLRITLRSPHGTRSVMQRLNSDTNSGPSNWTYWSTHHFYESSVGVWTMEVSDQFASGAGSLEGVELIVTGVPINDSDHDGLDDSWELANLGSLNYGPNEDPDRDGFSNAREQILGTNPLVPDRPFEQDLSRWSPLISRLSWPGSPHFNYQVWGGSNPGSLALVTNLAAVFPETEWFFPATNSHEFFQIKAVPSP